MTEQSKTTIQLKSVTFSKEKSEGATFVSQPTLVATVTFEFEAERETEKEPYHISFQERVVCESDHPQVDDVVQQAAFALHTLLTDLVSCLSQRYGSPDSQNDS